ncbi:hypothetical protein PHMEG_00033289 [Phytophthora megakarya]|uniref:Uncharacterized protein n=1 Tax=Phytophthora megakarya TaxID=4795 RepID=A0A225UU22_9STRA|nr:hypothetical protein PHMEG_00033289 [Phytophthora megakarya]
MTGPRHAQKKAGRGDGGREDESLRRSRRKQGLPPMEYKDLDVVGRESRATKKAAQDAERAVAQEQPDSEPAAGDDQVLSNVASPEAPLSESGTTRVEGESTRDESAQASVGGADMVEPPVADALVKVYVAHQVHHWEQVPSGRVFPPQVAYAWSEVPDYASWFEAAKAVSDFVLQQACLDNRDEAWIFEFRPERRGFGRVQELAAIQVPVILLEARQCTAVLQTLFFEAEFLFNNVLPEWFWTHAVNVGLDQIRFVT